MDTYETQAQYEQRRRDECAAPAQSDTSGLVLHTTWHLIRWLPTGRNMAGEERFYDWLVCDFSTEESALAARDRSQATDTACRYEVRRVDRWETPRRPINWGSEGFGLNRTFDPSDRFGG